MAVAKILYSAGAAFAIYSTWKLLRWALRPLFSPLRSLPGPSNPSWIFGNLRDIFKEDPMVLHERWHQQYGSTYKYKAILNSDRLSTFDTRALNHMLTHSLDYQKPEMARHQLAEILGEGVLVAEGETHRKQRRIMNPGFGPAQIRELTSVFVQKASELRDGWITEINNTGVDGVARIDVLSWLSRATLDIIGLAGFNYEFESLNPNVPRNELNEAFSTIFRAGESFNLFPLFQYFIPPLRLISNDRARTVKFAQETMRRIGTRLIAEKKAAVRAEKDRGHVGKDDLRGRDLLSILVRANMAVDVPDNQRLSDEDILAQIPTFMVAGHETTSTGTTWALFALTQRPDVQSRLREELLEFPSDSPTMDELQAFPYLDAVVRETMRVHSPVPSTVRVAMKDDVIPLAEPFINRNGESQSEIRISKGETIFIPILGVNRAKNIWGEDAQEFKPERWLQPLPDTVTNVPGVWGNLLTFLGGPHACIGYRFSVVEMKALLFVLIRTFEFELAVPVTEIKKKSTAVTRPLVASESDKGNQLPLLVRLHQPQV